MPASALRRPQHPETEPSAAALDDTAEWISLLWPDAAPESRHSRRVALLKRVLPAVGIALLLLVAVWPRLAPLWERMRFAFPAIDLREARELRMINPRYAGTDRLGRPFVVTAAAGRQVPDRQDLMSLEAPRADMKTPGGGKIAVSATTGIYQAQAQLLDLFGEVTLVLQNGTRFVTDRARIEIANNSAEGSDPVVGHGPSSDIKAEGFRLLDRGDVIVLTGRSDVLLRQAKPGSEKSTPAASPAWVAAAVTPAAAAAHPHPAVHRAAATRPASAAAPHPPVRARPVARKPG